MNKVKLTVLGAKAWPRIKKAELNDFCHALFFKLPARSFYSLAMRMKEISVLFLSTKFNEEKLNSQKNCKI